MLKKSCSVTRPTSWPPATTGRAPMPNWRISLSACSGATVRRHVPRVAVHDVGDGGRVARRAAGERPHHRPVRHQPDQRAVALLDEHLADVVPVEQVGDQLERVVRRHADEVGHHQLLDAGEVVLPLPALVELADVHSAEPRAPLDAPPSLPSRSSRRCPLVPWCSGIAASDTRAHREPVRPTAAALDDAEVALDVRVVEAHRRKPAAAIGKSLSRPRARDAVEPDHARALGAATKVGAGLVERHRG